MYARSQRVSGTDCLTSRRPGVEGLVVGSTTLTASDSARNVSAMAVGCGGRRLRGMLHGAGCSHLSDRKVWVREDTGASCRHSGEVSGVSVSTMAGVDREDDALAGSCQTRALVWADGYWRTLLRETDSTGSMGRNGVGSDGCRGLAQAVSITKVSMPRAGEVSGRGWRSSYATGAGVQTSTMVWENWRWRTQAQV